MPDPINVILISSGVKPNIRINPGALEKPIVLKSWPWSASVLDSGNSFAPIK